jgi:hypothetical protein
VGCTRVVILRTPRLRQCERVRCGTTGGVLGRESVWPTTRGRFHLPEYLGSSLSSLRRRNCTSGGISVAFSGFSLVSASLSSSLFSLAFSVASSVGSAFSFGRGVPARLGWSSSSPMTNSGSNSEGSGPLPVGAALLLSPSFDLAVLFEGDRLREPERRVVELDRGGVDGVVRCFACSSAIRASMAPRMRWVQVSLHHRCGVECIYLKALKHGEGRQTMRGSRKK